MSTTTPDLMTPIGLAMAIDYSLFMLRRMQAELLRGGTMDEAMTVMLLTSGRVVLTSGLTLILIFLCMLYIPVSLISSMGLGAAITVLFDVILCLTALPTIILMAPRFWTSGRWLGFSRDGCCFCDKKPSEDAFAIPGTPQEEVTVHTEIQRSCWGKVYSNVQRFDWGVLLILVAFMFPFAINGLGLKGLDKTSES